MTAAATQMNVSADHWQLAYHLCHKYVFSSTGIIKIQQHFHISHENILKNQIYINFLHTFIRKINFPSKDILIHLGHAHLLYRIKLEI